MRMIFWDLGFHEIFMKNFFGKFWKEMGKDIFMKVS